MENEIINTLQDGEPVTSTYAEIYYDDEYCDYKQSVPDSAKDKANVIKPKSLFGADASEWVSPSDLLIGVVELTPPFTSKITRGITHEGILNIGNDVLAVERAKFLKYLTDLVHDNDAAWNIILQYEKAAVERKVTELYKNIFDTKSKTMKIEIAKYYEQTLWELEQNVKLQVENVLMSSHASIVNKLNTDIKTILKKEKQFLEATLKKRFDSEVAKLSRYYKLLLANEKLRCKKFVTKTIVERNDAIQAFIRQIEAENITTTMYILSTERKKCKIKQLILENYQTQELKEKCEKLKQRQEIIDIFKDREVHISQINRDWENKIKKILQLFLKFISFSLKLLPEQTSFLLNFEKMVVLQLNDIQKMPQKVSSLLIDSESLADQFKFEELEDKEEKCTKEPFVITGGYLSGTPSTQYGSRETIPDDVDLPAVRLQRQFIYAKCHKYEEIKKRLEDERCKCLDIRTIMPPTEPKPGPSKPVQKIETPKSDTSSVSESIENLVIDDIHRFDECPFRNCQDWINKSPFPHLNAYLDFDDKKFERVVTILGKLDDKSEVPKFIDPKDITREELTFGPTKEKYHTVETQYSSEEDIVSDLTCPCVENYFSGKLPLTNNLPETPSKVLMNKMTKRKLSLRRLLQQNPEMLKTLTVESFDFIF